MDDEQHINIFEEYRKIARIMMRRAIKLAIESTEVNDEELEFEYKIQSRVWAEAAEMIDPNLSMDAMISK